MEDPEWLENTCISSLMFNSSRVYRTEEGFFMAIYMDILSHNVMTHVKMLLKKNLVDSEIDLYFQFV